MLFVCDHALAFGCIPPPQIRSPTPNRVPSLSSVTKVRNNVPLRDSILLGGLQAPKNATNVSDGGKNDEIDNNTNNDDGDDG